MQTMLLSRDGDGRGGETMKVFEIVKTVLDEEYESISPKAERDSKISKALKELSTAYNKVKNRGGPPLSDPSGKICVYLQIHDGPR
jgi:hypothetical protein